MAELVKEAGGIYTPDLTRDCTHLIALKPEGKKHEYAKTWDLKIVNENWLYESVKANVCLDESYYALEKDPDFEEKFFQFANFYMPANMATDRRKKVGGIIEDAGGTVYDSIEANAIHYLILDFAPDSQYVSRVSFSEFLIAELDKPSRRCRESCQSSIRLGFSSAKMPSGWFPGKIFFLATFRPILPLPPLPQSQTPLSRNTIQNRPWSSRKQKSQKDSMRC